MLEFWASGALGEMGILRGGSLLELTVADDSALTTNTATAVTDAAIKDLYVADDTNSQAVVDISSLFSPNNDDTKKDIHLLIQRKTLNGKVDQKLFDDTLDQFTSASETLSATDQARDWVIKEWLVDNPSDKREVDVHLYHDSVTLDNDSENISPLAAPNGSAQEEYLEDNPTYALGKLIQPNTGDINQDGVLDCWDGYNIGWDDLTHSNPNHSANFVQITVTLPEGMDYSTAKLEFDYTMAMAVIPSNTSAPPNGDGSIRIWTRNGSEARNGAYVSDDQSPGSSGDLIMANWALKASDFGFSDTKRTVTFFVEGVAENRNIQTYSEVQQYGKPTTAITIKLFADGNLNKPAVTDTVHYIVGGSDTFYWQLLHHPELRAALACNGIYSRDNMSKYCLQLLSFEQLISCGFTPVDANWLSSDDLYSGFGAGVYHDYISGDNLLVFEGTNPKTISDWVANFKQGLGFTSCQYTTAMTLATDLRHRWDRRPAQPPSVLTPTTPADWLITGHSLGGGLAAAASIVSGFRAMTFNAAGVNFTTVQPFDPTITSQAQLETAAKRIITSYVVNGEILNYFQDSPSMLALYVSPAVYLSLLVVGMPPQSIGTRVTLDSHVSILVPIPLLWWQNAASLYQRGTLHSYYIESLLLSYGFPLS